MRKVFNQLVDTLRDFLKQRDDLLLLVPCEDSAVPLLLMALRTLDRESASDLFLLFAEDFSESETFLDSIAGRLQEEHDMTNEAGPDVPKLPPLPADFLDPTASPYARLEAGMQYAHSLIDSRLGQHFVWAMGPGSITNTNSYLTLLARLLPRPEIQPWMRGARIVARAPADYTLPAGHLKRVRVKPFTIPPNAQEEELVATAGDSTQPTGERMQAEVQLAYLDYAHGRFAEAVERFLKALAYFQWAELPVMEALVICGLGAIARRQENLPEAHHWYECAVVPAAKDGNPVLMSTIVENLATIAFQEGRFAEAEERFGELVVVKRAMVDEDGIADALEQQGLSQEAQRAYDRAVDCWYESALICRVFEMDERMPRVLAHLKRGYQALDMRIELEQFDKEWARG